MHVMPSQPAAHAVYHKLVRRIVADIKTLGKSHGVIGLHSLAQPLLAGYRSPPLQPPRANVNDEAARDPLGTLVRILEWGVSATTGSRFDALADVNRALHARHGKLRTAKPGTQKALADERLMLDKGMTLEEVARHNGEPFYTARSRRRRLLKRRKQGTQRPAEC
jgi:hypothetical protein